MARERGGGLVDGGKLRGNCSVLGRVLGMIHGLYPTDVGPVEVVTETDRSIMTVLLPAEVL